MTLRSKLVLYLVVLHVALGVLAAFVIADHREWLFGAEAVVLASAFVAYRLVASLFVPLQLIATGADLIAERDFSSQFATVGQPELDRLIAIYNEMIGRLRAERLAGEEQQQFLRKLVDASPSGVVVCDFEGRPTEMNAAARRLVTPDLLEQLPGMTAGESRLVTREPLVRLKVWCAEFRDRGFPKRFFLVEELSEEIRASERAAYEKLIRMMSHEVNNSVGAVRSLIESVLNYASAVPDEHRGEFVSALTIASARMDSLNRFMSGFADVIRIPKPRLRSVALRPLVERVAGLLRPEAEARQVVIAGEVDAALHLDADEEQFEQVVINVVRNAMDAMPDGGRISITARDGTLSIADTGSGIDDGIAGDLFDPFFTTKRDGRGLGLTIVQEILSNHGFPFSLRNREEGGAEFRIGLRAAG